jgi:hypothetical protein
MVEPQEITKAIKAVIVALGAAGIQISPELTDIILSVVGGVMTLLYAWESWDKHKKRLVTERCK